MNIRQIYAASRGVMNDHPATTLAHLIALARISGPPLKVKAIAAAKSGPAEVYACDVDVEFDK